MLAAPSALVAFREGRRPWRVSLTQRDGAALIRDQMSLQPLQRSRAAAIRLDLAALRKLAALALAKVHKCTAAGKFVFTSAPTGGHLHIRFGTAKPYG